MQPDNKKTEGEVTSSNMQDFLGLAEGKGSSLTIVVPFKQVA